MAPLRLFRPALLMASACAAPPAQAWESLTEARSITYSESFNVAALLDGLSTGPSGDGFRDGGDLAFTHNAAFAGASWRGFEAGLMARYDYSADYDPEAALVVNAIVNAREIFAGDYRANIAINHVYGFGGFIGYRQDFGDRLELGARLSVFSGEASFEGSLDGIVRLRVDEPVGFDATVDYRFSDDILLSRPVPAPEGTGFALDVSARWRPTHWLDLELEVLDAFAEIHWSEIARTTADALSDTLTRNENGILQARPSIRGQFARDGHVQELDPRARLAASVDLPGAWTAAQDVRLVHGQYLAETEISYRFSDTLSAGLRTEWETTSFGASVTWHGFALEIVTDNINPEKARYLRGQLAWQLNF